MAFNIVNIFPNDLKPQVAIGVDIPFNGNAVFTPNYQTKNAIKNNLINFFLTNPGERIGNPNFGGGIRSFIFNQLKEDNLDFLKEDIQSKLNNYFPNINVISIEMVSNTENNTLKILLYYDIVGTNIQDNLELNFV